MLTSTFCCFRGVGEGAEQRLWQRGIQTWTQLQHRGPDFFSARKWQLLREELAYAEVALQARAADHFLSRLDGRAKFRILRDFSDDMCFVDIETEGLGRDARITTVALLREEQLKVYVRGRDLHEAIPALAHAPILVTFNGACFDLPRLRREFGLNLGQAHLDLRPTLRATGLQGGQKAIEKKCRICRLQSDGLNGAEAVRLWKRYADSGDRDALRRLCAYNAEDVLVMRALLTSSFNNSVASFPLDVRLPPFSLQDRIRLLQSCSLTIE